jgi:diamine N-acetyltransferase
MQPQSVVVRISPVTRDNVLLVCALSVAPDQERFVSPNAVSLAEAYVRAEAKPFAVVADEAVVGFAMLYDDRELPVVGLWRLMIDRDHQRRGYGAQTVELLVSHARGLRPLESMHVGAMTGPGGPGPFYEGLGFEPTGEVRDDGEVRYRLPLGLT